MAAKRTVSKKRGAAKSGGRAGKAQDAAPEVVRTLSVLPPWLASDGAALHERERGGRFPHALLVHGAAGIGKRAFARWFAENVLCLRSTASGACGACASCRQLLAGSHPDYRELQPEGMGIRIDAVRELLEWQRMAAPDGRWRVALLDGADTLNRAAANALLKTLEEPADGALLLLVADSAARLPATVRSRCQPVLLRLGSGEARDQALAWLGQERRGDGIDAIAAEGLLARSGGAPLAALALAQPDALAEETLIRTAWLDLFLHRASVGRIVDALSALPTRRSLSSFARLSALAVRHRAGLPDGPDPAEQAIVSQVAERLDDEQWFTVRDQVVRLHRIDGPSFRAQAVLEGLLADIRLMLNHEVAE